MLSEAEKQVNAERGFESWAGPDVITIAKTRLARADNPGKPTGGHGTSHRSPTCGHRRRHDTFCGGQRCGKSSCCIQNIAKIVTRTCINVTTG